LEESQNKKWNGCSLFFIRGKDQDIERLKRGGCYEREKQRGERKQEGAAEKPQREEKGEEGEEEQVGLKEALGITSSSAMKFIFKVSSTKKLAGRGGVKIIGPVSPFVEPYRRRRKYDLIKS